LARVKKRVKPAKTSHRAKHAAQRSTGPGSARPTWQGNLRLSLVSCPVSLYGATTRANDVSFHLLNPKTHNRIRMIPADPETGPVERAKLVKGYEISKNKYVLVTDDELDDVRLETTRTIDIERFVDETTIDRLYWNDPYYLLPDGESAVEAYSVICDAMRSAGKVALGRVVMHTRERLVAIEPRDGGLIATTLRMRDEVIEPSVFFHDIPKTRPDKRMIEIAERIIAQQEGPFEPEEFRDRYEGALRDLVKRKERGERPVSAPPPQESNVIDLMDALQKSLKQRGTSASSRAHAEKLHKRAR
jgi:DNA end-binding protein Ku